MIQAPYVLRVGMLNLDQAIHRIFGWDRSKETEVFLRIAVLKIIIKNLSKISMMASVF